MAEAHKVSTRECEPLLEAPVTSQGASAANPKSAGAVLARLAERRASAWRARPSRWASWHITGPVRARTGRPGGRGERGASYGLETQTETKTQVGMEAASAERSAAEA
jgi:hypothetical protein